MSEIAVNALVHRSLTWQTPVRVFVFDDRGEIHSPGELTHGLTVDDIKRGVSFPRNSLLFANAVYLLPYTGIGSGILRAIQLGGNVEFRNDERLHDFIVTFTKSNHQEERVTIKNADVVLSERQKQVVDFCNVPRTAQEILDYLEISNQSKNRKKYITSLVNVGILAMTIPDFPKDKKQKYRKV